MISNPDLIFYACISKGPTTLAEFTSSKEPGIEDIAKRCIERTPPLHSTFSHTVRRKTYTFLINDPVAYFVISHESLEKSECFWFLNRVKIAFEEFSGANPVKDFDELTYNCFQEQFCPIFRNILSLNVELVDSLMEVPKDIRNPSLDSTRGKRSVVRPLLSKPAKLMMKKKKRQALGCAGCVSDGGGGGGEANVVDNNNNNNNNNYKVNHVGENVVVNREFSVSMHKNGGGFYMGDGRQKAKQIWRKHVWVVLILDLVICAVLFGIWLWICRGFKCIDG
ncbi:phytolongin Phyl2.2 [Ricinus communis]|uniref:phytolongin Phyl2.2 n=1 Tax=Ricinus communis TaxID=3988 RepID=UPI00201A46F3|nr:phytolongin Phyl2.2 [Ricinus communis]